MRATKRWKCNCGCTEHIEPGEEFIIREGFFYRIEHSTGELDLGIPAQTAPTKLQGKGITQKNLEELPLFETCPCVQQSLF